MDLISLIVILAVIGGLLWAVNSYIPMQATIKKILNVVVIGGTVLWLLNVFGVNFGNIQIPHTH
jgi:hypothetical protein